MKNSTFALTAILLTIVLSLELFPQDTTQSLAFRNNKPKRKTVFYQPDLSYQIWQQFNLNKEANSGNVLAQHELGIRYLIGEGVKADTVLGAYWIKKAAEKKLAAASFNYGILLLNGWGVEWNPFLAFTNFKLAADDGMPEAAYIVGSLYTDNLVVKRDLNLAYYWLKKSADAGYEPAKKSVKHILNNPEADKIDTNNVKQQQAARQNTSINDTTQKVNNGNSITSAIGLVFIDFDFNQDTTIVVSGNDLLEDLVLINNDALTESVYINTPGGDSLLSFDSLDISLVLKFAENGSPEALAILGYFYENGKYFQQNIINALNYYIRAIRMDSPKAPLLLYELTKKSRFTQVLKRLTDDNNAEAMYVWNGLYTLGFDNTITEGDALNLLVRSAEAGYGPSIVELGQNYLSGKMVKQDQVKGLEFLQKAEESGSLDGKVRKATTIIFDDNKIAEYATAFENILMAADSGNLLAQVTLAHCYETGKGTRQNYSNAVKYYRLAAQRGSQYSYKELKRLYDTLRPDDSVFKVD